MRDDWKLVGPLGRLWDSWPGAIPICKTLKVLMLTRHMTRHVVLVGALACGLMLMVVFASVQSYRICRSFNHEVSWKSLRHPKALELTRGVMVWSYQSGLGTKRLCFSFGDTTLTGFIRAVGAPLSERSTSALHMAVFAQLAAAKDVTKKLAFLRRLATSSPECNMMLVRGGLARAVGLDLASGWHILTSGFATTMSGCER